MYPWHECLMDILSTMSSCWTLWPVWGMVEEFMSHKYDKKTKTKILDRTMKMVHTEVLDSSVDEESMAFMQANNKKSKVFGFSNWPRFFVISSNDEGALKKLSPFDIQKGFMVSIITTHCRDARR